MKRTVTIEPAGGVADVRFRELLSIGECTYASLPFTTIKYEFVTGSSPRQYVLRVSAVDGRVWKQRVTFDVAANPLVHFENGTHEFRSTETACLRDLRVALDALAVAKVDLTVAQVDFE